MAEPVVLTGLDGSNPIGFLAAVGLLRWLDEVNVPARLSFRDGDWRAVLHGVEKPEQWWAAIAEDAKRRLDTSPLTFTYDKKGTGEGDIADLKPPPARFRSWLQALRSAGDETGMAFAMGYASEGGRDRSNMIKPTALHFTAGQQQFLGSVREVAEALTEDDVREAVFGPWKYARKVKTLSWDASVSRDYALRYGNPAKETRLGNPGADWLAFLALPAFPVAARGSQAQTACCGGGWKTGHFRWPLWGVPASARAVGSLLLAERLESWTVQQRRLMGIVAVFASDISRSDQGGYGAFGPAHVATEADSAKAR